MQTFMPLNFVVVVYCFLLFIIFTIDSSLGLALAGALCIGLSFFLETFSIDSQFSLIQSPYYDIFLEVTIITHQ